MVLRQAAPTNLPVSIVARAAHWPAPVRRIILHPLAAHSLRAFSTAFCAVGSFQLQPRLPVSWSQAIAPNPAKAAVAESRTDARASVAAMVEMARRIERVSFT